jgi:hypothetical protein
VAVQEATLRAAALRLVHVLAATSPSREFDFHEKLREVADEPAARKMLGTERR